MRLISILFCLLLLVPAAVADHDHGEGQGHQDPSADSGDEPTTTTEVSQERAPGEDKCPWLVISGPSTQYPFFAISFIPECWPPV